MARDDSPGHNVLSALTAMVEGQTDPQFRTTCLETRLTAGGVRRQVIAREVFHDEDVPTAETMANTRNQWPGVSPTHTPGDRCHLDPGEATAGGGG